MNQTELIAKVAKRSDNSKKDTKVIVDAVFETILEELAKGEKVSFLGFGTFSVTERAARKGRNPQTGEEMDIPATKSPKFKPGKQLKDAVKQGL